MKSRRFKDIKYDDDDNDDDDATRIKMQRGSRCDKDKNATRIKMQRGSRYNKDQAWDNSMALPQ